MWKQIYKYTSSAILIVDTEGNVLSILSLVDDNRLSVDWTPLLISYRTSIIIILKFDYTVI